MPAVALEAQSQLAELVGRLAPGEEVTLTRDDRPVATLKAIAPTAAATPPAGWQRPGPGLLKGMITYMAPDFDAPLEDLREYME